MRLMHLQVYVWCLLIKIFVNCEIITLINRQNVTCVTTGEDVNSTIYLHPVTNVPLKDVTSIKSLEYKLGNLQSIRKKIITDQRWQDFKVQNNKLEIAPPQDVAFSFNGKENFIVVINNKPSEKATSNVCVKWCHFQLSIEDNTVRIKDRQNNNIFLKKSPENIENITLTSPSPSFWKLHKFHVRKINKHSKITISHTGPLRLSMFVYLNKYSNLNLYLISNNKTTPRNISGNRKPQEWQKVEMTIESVNTTTLLIKPSKLAKWAVDKINFYPTNIGVYKATNISTTSNQTYICKKLSNSSKTKISDARKLNNCNQGKYMYLGSSCNIPCEDILGKEFKKCEEHKICEDTCYCPEGYTGDYCDEQLKNTLQIREVTSNSISLSWMAPKIPKTYKYILKYECKNFFCANNRNEEKKVENIAGYTIQYLKPSTECSVQLYNSHKNLIASISGTTKNTEKQITGEELPIEFLFLENHLIFQFEQCDYFYGPLSFKFRFKCVSPWCKKENRNITFNMTQYIQKKIYTTKKFLPFTDYQLKVDASRFDSHLTKEYPIQKTVPGIPKKVKNLKINCRNSTTAMISWEAPDPPTGKLSHYVITTTSGKNVNKSNSIETSATIEHLQSDTQYTIEISAKNQNVEESGEPESLTIPKFESFEKPQNLSFKLLSRKKLRLTWNHPIIKDFSISVLGKHSENFPVISEKCQKMYQHELQLDYEDNHIINVWGLGAPPENRTYINITRKYAYFAPQPFLTFCVETKCLLLLVPKPKDVDTNSNFTILIKNKHNETDKRLLTDLTLIEDYFHIKLGDQVVSLENETYKMSLIINNKSVYPFSEQKIHIASLAGQIVLCLVSLITVIFVCYLCYAYKHAVYPFELNNKPQDNEQWTIMEFTEQYRTNSIKRVRPKCDSPPKDEELEVLAPKTTVNINAFEDYLMDSLGDDPKNNDLTHQYKAIPNPTKPRTVALLKRNVPKNRYKNIIAFDETRVKLKDCYDYDYINASYVDGYEVPKAFIATQAPMESTTGEFWWMVWQENVKTIIMLTELVENNVEKCAQYWPEMDSKMRCGKILIENTDQKIHADFVHRKLTVSCDKETRLIEHLQFTTWPDHQVPLYPQNFTDFMKKMLAISQNDCRIVVHCNAGCGRTGTLILCDRVLRMAAKEKKLDFVKTLTEMRQQRTYLVSNVDQYIFAHFIVLECLFGVDFSIPINDSFQDEVMKVLRKTTVKPVMEHLDKVIMQFRKRQLKLSTSINEKDKSKNRFSDILPGNAKVLLQTSPKCPSSYINAVVVDCYRCPQKFIVTQQPLPNTLDDFWRMIKYREINTIVSLNEIDGSDPRCPKFWPLDSHSTRLEVLENTDEKIYSIIKLKITNKSKIEDKPDVKIINVLEMKNWKRETPQPRNPKDLIIVLKEMFNNSWKGTSQIVVTCYDGATASGLFVALAFLLEKINYEQKCDVFSAIRTVRQSREQFVQEWGQLEFLYKAAKVYIEEFDNYENFQD
ncbi:uncharacterized protein LOC123011031 [Tribolium madens]|uniref:uncharacterized protein LOC123011031 n=1 Tax=Tribolium madens TaxID=41895 RepID=UPI001CF737AE|nr:uncharacterized protein LOC123011031 [Tribolium madens]